MSKEKRDERLAFRASSRLVSELEDIKDLKDHDHLSDSIRESIDFYHNYLVRGKGMGTIILHLPKGMLTRANYLVGSIDVDVKGVLRQALNLGLAFLLEDTVRQDENAKKVKRSKEDYIQEVENNLATL